MCLENDLKTCKKILEELISKEEDVEHLNMLKNYYSNIMGVLE